MGEHDALQSSRDKGRTPVCTLPDVDAKASANTMADRLAELKAVKVGELLTDVKVAAPV